MALDQWLTELYLSRLLARPEGRAHLLAQLADAESNGEGQVFDRALARAGDPDVARLIRRHAADEVRHSELFWRCAERNGRTGREVPAELQLIGRLDRALGGILDRPIEGRTDIMQLYLLLQVIEERAITQLALFEPAFRRVDVETAEVMAEVCRDEERHLRYCHAISQRYAPDARTLRENLASYRKVEAQVFAENAAANMRYAIARRLVDARGAEGLLWSGLARLAAVRPIRQRTAYWGSERGRASEPGDTRALAEAA